VNPMPLLLSLLVAAYIGSLWVSGRGRGYGLPSGVEYVVLGTLLGPQWSGVIGADVLSAFNPIAFVALGWLALGFGLQCGVIGERSVPAHRIALGSVFAAATAAITGFTVLFVGPFLGFARDENLWITSGAIGLLSCETTRHAVRWVSDRHLTEGPLSELITDLSSADDAIVLVALAVLFAWFDEPRAILGTVMPRGTSAALALGLGMALGLVAAALIRTMSHRVDWWGVLLGASLLCIGSTNSLGMSAMSAMFAMGLSLSAASHEGAALREMFARTERAVLLPALILAGGHLVMPRSLQAGALVLSAVLGRAVASYLSGVLLGSMRSYARPGASWLGLGMLSSGTLTMTVGFAVALRFDPAIGDLALAAAFVGTVAGELLGPVALRKALTRCGEIRKLTPSGQVDIAISEQAKS